MQNKAFEGKLVSLRVFPEYSYSFNRKALQDKEIWQI